MFCHSKYAGQTQYKDGKIPERGDKADSIAICFTDITMYFDHLIKTANPLG